jgi:hypothetical protein
MHQQRRECAGARAPQTYERQVRFVKPAPFHPAPDTQQIDDAIDKKSIRTTFRSVGKKPRTSGAFRVRCPITSTHARLMLIRNCDIRQTGDQRSRVRGVRLYWSRSLRPAETT